MQTYDGTLKETGARYKASYHCTNTRYRDANSVLYHYASCDERSERKRRTGNAIEKRGGGFIYLTKKKKMHNTSKISLVSTKIYLFFIDSCMYAGYSTSCHLSQKFKIKGEISVIYFIHHARTSCFSTISFRKIEQLRKQDF